MKIGILIATLVPYGAEKAALRLSQGLKDRGVDVTILVTDTPTSVQSGDIPIIPMLHGGELNLAEKLFYAPLQYIRLHRTIKKEQFDVLISFMERANIFNLALPGGQKRIITIHSFLKRSLKERPIINRVSAKLFYTFFVNRADLTICVSRALMDDFLNTFPIKSDKLKVIYNPCDIEQMLSLSQEPIEAQYHKLFEGNVIIHVGRFSKDKGQWYLIRAFKKILNTIPDVRLVFLGDGELRGYTEKLTNDLGIVDKVHFLGFQQNPFKFMSRATVFSFPSLWEGFPVALVEALICKAAVVAADCKSGPRELLAPDTDFSRTAQGIEKAEYGILIPPFDGNFKDANSPLTKEESMLAEALLTLLQDSSLRRHYKEVGYRRVDAFRSDRIIDKWMDLLKNV
jgi:glycosyltransferase involved in cell wall biosynthesis